MIYEGATSLNLLVVNGEEFTEVGNVAVSAKMEVKGIDGAVLLPSVTSDERLALDNADFTVQGGMQVFDTDLNAPLNYIDTVGWASPSTLIKEIEYQFTTQQIIELDNFPIDLLPAPGVGFFYSILDISFSNNAVGVDPFLAGSDLEFSYGINFVSAIDQNVPAALIRSAVRSFYFSQGWSGNDAGSNEPISFAEVENQEIVLRVTGAPFTNGTDSVISLIIRYRIVSL